MSYDINIWSQAALQIPSSLPFPEKWTIGDGWADYEGRDWHIVVGNSTAVLEEDVPDEIAFMLPGIQYLTEINLEPIHAPVVARTLLNRIARHIGRSISGIVEDCQTDILSTPTGVKRYAPARHEPERFSIVEMSFWFLSGPFVQNHATAWPTLLTYFKKKLPEALPRRYGLYEPPPHKYSETSEAHLVEFLDTHKYDFIVWYPHPPVTDVYLTVQKQCGFETRFGEEKFLTHHLKLGIDAGVLSQVGWQTQLKRVWLDLAEITLPFYGEVRTLHDYVRGRGTYATDMQTDVHPVPSSWWAGIPRTLGQAIVVGEPYLTRWPKITQIGESIDGLKLVSTENWAEESDVTSVTGPVPDQIAQTRTPGYVETKMGKLTGWMLSYNQMGFPPDFPFPR